jgi:hypothetical protein
MPDSCCKAKSTDPIKTTVAKRGLVMNKLHGQTEFRLQEQHRCNKMDNRIACTIEVATIEQF